MGFKVNKKCQMIPCCLKKSPELDHLKILHQGKSSSSSWCPCSSWAAASSFRSVVYYHWTHFKVTSNRTFFCLNLSSTKDVAEAIWCAKPPNIWAIWFWEKEIIRHPFEPKVKRAWSRQLHSPEESWEGHGKSFLPEHVSKVRNFKLNFIKKLHLFFVG